MSENTKPYRSWTFDENTNEWVAPKPRPTEENKSILWNDMLQVWETSKSSYPSWTLHDIGYGEKMWVPPVPRPRRTASSPEQIKNSPVLLWDEENQIWQERDSFI